MRTNTYSTRIAELRNLLGPAAVQALNEGYIREHYEKFINFLGLNDRSSVRKAYVDSAFSSNKIGSLILYSTSLFRNRSCEILAGREEFVFLVARDQEEIFENVKLRGNDMKYIRDNNFRSDREAGAWYLKAVDLGFEVGYHQGRVIDNTAQAILAIKKAIELYEAHLENDPEDAFACLRLGYSYGFLAEYTRAVRYFKKAMKLGGEDQDVYFIREADTAIASCMFRLEEISRCS